MENKKTLMDRVLDLDEKYQLKTVLRDIVSSLPSCSTPPVPVEEAGSTQGDEVYVIDELIHIYQECRNQNDLSSVRGKTMGQVLSSLGRIRRCVVGQRSRDKYAASLEDLRCVIDAQLHPDGWCIRVADCNGDYKDVPAKEAAEKLKDWFKATSSLASDNARLRIELDSLRKGLSLARKTALKALDDIEAARKASDVDKVSGDE